MARPPCNFQCHLENEKDDAIDEDGNWGIVDHQRDDATRRKINQNKRGHKNHLRGDRWGI